MPTKIQWISILVTGAVLAGCSAVDDGGDRELAAASVVPSECTTVRDGDATALFVNQSVHAVTFANPCDIAIYFDENAPEGATVSNVEVTHPDTGAGKTYGVWNDGGVVDVLDSSFATDATGQHVYALFEGGALGTIRGNEMNGDHRAAIVVRGEGTDVTIRENEIVGVGPKTTGWAQNAIQVDSGAQARIRGNVVRDHWWDTPDWLVAGVLIFGADDTVVHGNDLAGNQAGIYAVGDGTRIQGNDVVAGHDVATTSDAYGMVVLGPSDNAKLIDNHVAAANRGLVGIGLFRATDAKVIRNRLDGFAAGHDIYDGSEGTKIHANISPAP